MIKTAKKWWEDKNKPTTPEQRQQNPTNLKGGIDAIREAQKKKKEQMDRILAE